MAQSWVERLAAVLIAPVMVPVIVIGWLLHKMKLVALDNHYIL